MEITEHHVYRRLARRIKGEQNRKTLERISGEELGHYQFFKRFSKRDAQPSRLKILFFYLVSRFLGLNFGVRLMEKGEKFAQANVARLRRLDPEVDRVVREEEEHERELLALIDQAELRYIGSIVLGLSDALVELTGVLAGLTFALGNVRTVAVAATITGVSAALSMAGSEYLSTKEEGGRSPWRAAVATGIAYFGVVFLLILPYLIFAQGMLCLMVALALALLVILLFTFYISVAKDLPFGHRFREMAAILAGVTVVTYLIGLGARAFLHVEV